MTPEYYKVEWIHVNASNPLYVVIYKNTRGAKVTFEDGSTHDLFQYQIDSWFGRKDIKFTKYEPEEAALIDEFSNLI